MNENTVLSLSYGRVVVKPPERLRGLVPESFETYQVVDPGDIIVRTTDVLDRVVKGGCSSEADEICPLLGLNFH